MTSLIFDLYEVNFFTLKNNFIFIFGCAGSYLLCGLFSSCVSGKNLFCVVTHSTLISVFAVRQLVLGAGCTIVNNKTLSLPKWTF